MLLVLTTLSCLYGEALPDSVLGFPPLGGLLVEGDK